MGGRTDFRVVAGARAAQRLNTVLSCPLAGRLHLTPETARGGIFRVERDAAPPRRASNWTFAVLNPMMWPSLRRPHVGDAHAGESWLRRARSGRGPRVARVARLRHHARRPRAGDRPLPVAP